MNPNNCETCKHKQNPDGGHCYMFREEPTEQCMQHTGLKVGLIFGDRKMMPAVLNELAEETAAFLRAGGMIKNQGEEA